MQINDKRVKDNTTFEIVELGEVFFLGRRILDADETLQVKRHVAQCSKYCGRSLRFF